MEEVTGLFVGRVDLKEECKDIGKDEEEIKDDLQEIKKWLLCQEYLPQNALSDAHLEKFLIGTKGKLESAKLRLDMYFSIRNVAPSLYTERDPCSELIRAAGETVYSVFLPELTPDRSRVLWIRLRRQDPADLDIVGYLRRMFVLLDVWLRTDPLATRIKVLIDDGPTTLGHIVKASPPRIREAVYCLQNVYPIRIQGIIFINVHPFMKTMMTRFVIPLFKKKMAKRFQFYTDNFSGLEESIPQSMWPSDYGGQSLSLEELNQKWIEIINKDRDWITTSGSEPSDESKREGKCPVSGPGCSIM